MAQFMVRVELHQAGGADYDRLHAAMEQTGFSRSITGSDGYRYQLPTAEYFASGNFTIDHVRDAACGAADTTGKRYAVLVSESIRHAWIGLPRSG